MTSIKYPIPAGATELNLIISDPVFTVPDPAPPNNAPTVNAGSDIVITLPVNVVNLRGNAADLDGTIRSVLWEQTAGATATIVSPTLATTEVNSLQEGISTFRFTATDDDGATAFDYVNITLKAAVQIPDPNGTPVVDNDFNDTKDLVADQLGAGSIVKDPAGTNNNCFRSYIPAGAAPISSGWRSEQQWSDDNANPVEEAVEYDVRYSKEHISSGYATSSYQKHPHNNNTSIMLLETSEGFFNIWRSPDGGSNKITKTQAVQPDRWYHIRWENKWINDGTGYIRLFIDGVKVYDFKGITTNESKPPYVKIGQNHTPSSPKINLTVWFKNLKIYKVG